MPTNREELSERELEILRLLATGASNKEIAGQLYISANTVKVHLRNIFAKTGVSSRTEAAMYAVSKGIIPADDFQHKAPAAQSENESAQESVEKSTEPFTPTMIRRRTIIFWAFGAVALIGISVFAYYLLQKSQSPALPSGMAPVSAARWEKLSEMPTARYSLATAVIGSEIYAIGGMTAQGVTSRVERYSIPRNAWADAADKPTPVYEASAATIGGKIYVPGGRLASGGPTDVLEIYDPYREEWTEGAPLPIALSGYALAAFEGKIYVFGGWDGQKQVASVFQYDPGLDAWKIKTPMPTARSQAGAAPMGDKILVIGGIDGEKALAVNEVYQPNLDSGVQQPWGSGASLPSPRGGLAVTSLADSIYVLGGRDGTQLSLPPLQYISLSGTWLEFENPVSEPLVSAGLVSSGTQIYTLGGEVSGAPSDQTLVYQAVYTLVLPIIRK